MSAIALSSIAAVSGRRAGTRAPAARRSSASSTRGGPVRTNALFGRKDPGGGVEVVFEESKSEAYARIKKQRAKSKAKFEAQEKGGVSLFLFNALSAVNFEEDIKEDRGLLAAAKRMGKGDKMSREQYGALKRKVGGTKGGFFGENIFAKGEYLDRGYVEKAEEQRCRCSGRIPLRRAGRGPRSHRVRRAPSARRAPSDRLDDDVRCSFAFVFDSESGRDPSADAGFRVRSFAIVFF